MSGVMTIDEEQLRKLLDTQAAQITGYVTRQLDERIHTLESNMNNRFDRLQTTVDGIAKHLDSFEQEQTIINHQVDGKLDQLAEATGIKWVTE